MARQKQKKEIDVEIKVTPLSKNDNAKKEIIEDRYIAFKQNFFQRTYNSFINFLANIPHKIFNFITHLLPTFIMSCFNKVVAEFKDVFNTFRRGDFKTKVSFVIFGFGHIFRGQIIKGLIFLIFEIMFILYMVFFGWKYLVLLGSLGRVAKVAYTDPVSGFEMYITNDNSSLIILYSIITIFLIISFIYMWRLNIKQNKINQELIEIGIKPKKIKDDIKSIADSEYHKTLLAIPTLGLFVFTILPMIFMVLIAFTNYDKATEPPISLYQWVGFDNFISMLGGGLTLDSKLFFYTFKQVLLWTVIWAFFATFSNYILGMIVAMLINKKGIKLKKLWRSVLIVTIAVPQFVSLMLLNQMLNDQGIINQVLIKAYNFVTFDFIDLLIDKVGTFNGTLENIRNAIPVFKGIPFLTNSIWAKITVIIVNIWVGIPYTMLICTGILMNIPDDLYESAKIDGASPVRMYAKITLPYMLFVTGPYLLNTFIGNLNNFNVIFLLTGGDPQTIDYQFAGKTDLLVTWLYKLTVDESNYKLASVIGIVMFIIIASISLIFYSRSNAVKNEEDFR